MHDFLPNVAPATYFNLQQIQFVNQAFLGLQFFQVQGRNHHPVDIWNCSNSEQKKSRANSDSASIFL